MKTRAQYAALPYIINSGNIEVLLITSRSTERWIIPKGWPEKGLAPHEVASKEALEEAGLEGKIKSKSIGNFQYLKHLPEDKQVTCIVDVFPLRVERHQIRWPEKGERKHTWVSPDLAVKLVQEEELAEILKKFSPKK